jgi:hypothetical protein
MGDHEINKSTDRFNEETSNKKSGCGILSLSDRIRIVSLISYALHTIALKIVIHIGWRIINFIK